MGIWQQKSQWSEMVAGFAGSISFKLLQRQIASLKKSPDESQDRNIKPLPSGYLMVNL